MRQAIVTKFYGPTNTRGSKIKAMACAGSVYVAYDHAMSIEENHVHAAMKLAHKFGWYGPKFDGNWIAGGLPEPSSNVFTYDDGETGDSRYKIEAP